MPIDRKRYEQFQEDLQALMRGLSASEQVAAFEAKVLDYLARNDVGPEDGFQIRRTVEQLFGDEMEPWTAKVFQRYHDVLDVVNTHYADLGVDVTRDFPRIYAIEQANAAELGAYQESVAEEVRQAVREGLVKKERVHQLAKRVAKAGDKAKLYARTIAKTQLKVVGRAAKTEKARIAEVQYYQYVGIARDTTRPFCLSLLGQTLHIDTIHQLRNGNKEPVIHNCGGWNCIHDWEPDPFASEQSEGSFFEAEEGSQTLTLFGGESAQADYETAKESNAEVEKRRRHSED